MEGSYDEAQNQRIKEYKDKNLSGILSSLQFLKFSMNVNVIFIISLKVYSIKEIKNNFTVM